MRFFSTLVAPLTMMMMAMLSSPGEAAECFAQSGGQGCATRDRVKLLSERFCEKYPDGNGDNEWATEASFSLWGKFENLQQCKDAFGNVIDQCHGKRNGGTWSHDKIFAGVDWCIQ